MVGAAFAGEIWYTANMIVSPAQAQSNLASRAISIVLLGPMFISGVLALLGVLAVMLFIAPKFQTVVSDFNLKLTPMQSAFFAISDSLRGTGGATGMWVVALPAIFVMAILIGIMTLNPSTRVVGRFLVLFMFLIAVGLVAVTIYSCYSPLISLIENLATNPQGTI